MKFYKCAICGNIVEKVVDKGVPVICCGKPMVELVANTSDGALEKHVPVAEVVDGMLQVKVGSMEHPMLAEHYIMFIAVEAGEHSFRVDLEAGKTPVASFPIGDYKGKIHVYEYCNLHGLWKTDIEA